jgi:predicted transcriptional regulator
MPSASTTSVKLDPETKERVQRLATARRRSSHWIMREAIAEYVSREEKREQLRQETMAAWEEFERTGLHVTAREADEWLSALASGENKLPPKCHV